MDRFNSGFMPSFVHLILHSDAEGYYVPIDFEQPIESDDLPGRYLGSVQRLHDECSAIAARLSMPIGLDPEHPQISHAADLQWGNTKEASLHNWNPFRRISKQQWTGALWESYGMETYGCLRLLAVCEASLRTGALVRYG